MLDRAGDTDGDVQLWRNDLAGLTDLHVVRYETCVDRSARSANSSAELVGQRVEVFEVVTVLHAATAGNDDLGSGQLRTVGLGQLFADEARSTGVVRSANGFNGSPNLDICTLDLLPSYNGHIPAEMADVYDLVEDRGTGGFPYGDYRDTTITFAELLALKTDTVDASLRRRLCAHTLKDATGNVIGLDRILHYSRQLSVAEWRRVLRYNREKTIA